MDWLIRNFKSNYADRSFLAEFQCPFWLWRSLEASLSDDEKSLKNFHSKVIRRRPRCLRRATAAPWARATKNVKKPQNQMCTLQYGINIAIRLLIF